MMNSLDKENMVVEISDMLRVKCNHRSVDLTGDDLNNLRNFIDELLSKYVDDKHLQGGER